MLGLERSLAGRMNELEAHTLHDRTPAGLDGPQPRCRQVNVRIHGEAGEHANA